MGYFITNPDSKFYQSGTFQGILNHLKNNPKAFKLKESNNRLSIIVEKINKVQRLLEFLNNIKAMPHYLQGQKKCLRHGNFSPL